MRSPVYRNLDTPFEIYGFSPAELIVLVAVFVFCGELAQALGVARVFALLAVGLAAVFIYLFRRAMGEYFFRRLSRFSRLPGFLCARLLHIGGPP